jgi:predicted neuraminidase
VSFGGWSGCALNHLQSFDNGETWSQPIRIMTNPFLNISTSVRTSPVNLVGGGFYLPAYHEFIRTYPLLLHFDANGRFLKQIRMTDELKILQPSVVPLTHKSGCAFFRNKVKAFPTAPLSLSFTHDGGQTWEKLQNTNLMISNSSIAAMKLNNGKLLLVFSEQNRNKLALAISINGIDWKKFYYLENHTSGEFSYPTVLLNQDKIDIFYTYNRRNIKHIHFNLAWLNEVLHATD